MVKTCSVSPRACDMDPKNCDIRLAVLSVLENAQTVVAAFGWGWEEQVIHDKMAPER